MASLSSPARNNLPRPSTGFVGRERDLSDLLRLLDSSRSVTLCGSDGLGKTRLALRVAEQSTVSFPDGVWVAGLSDTRTALDVYVRVAAAVGVVEEPGQPLAVTVQEALRHRRLLLVLDSCGHVAEGVTEVGEALLATCPDVAILLTSEPPLRLSGGTIWRVPPMALPVAARHAPPPDPAEAEAVRLFLDRARARDSRFSVSATGLETITLLCNLVGGVPLGIELLGACSPGQDLDDLAADLRAFLSSPAARPGPGQAVSRSQVLPVVMDFLHQGLPEAEQKLLRRLSVFRDWDLELAEQICTDEELAESHILDLLTSLLNRAWITVTGELEGRVRYRLPDAVRAYAAERLVEAGEEDLFQERLLSRMFHLLEDLNDKLESSRVVPWSERDAARKRVLAEYETLRALVARAQKQRDVESGLRLCVGLVAHWVSLHNPTEGAHWMDDLLALPGADRAPSLARALVARAQLARLQRDHELAVSLGEEGLALCRAAGDDVFVRTSLNLLALVAMRERLPERAAVRVEEALRLCRETGDQWREAITLGTRAALVAQQGDYSTADQHYNAALTLLRGVDHRWGVGVVLLGQAHAAEANSDLITADRCYREALDTQRLIGTPAEEARCLTGIGRTAHAQDRTGQAYDYLSEGLALSHAAGQRADVARSLVAIARVAFGQGLRERACRLAGAATAVREQLGLRTFSAPWPFTGTEVDGQQQHALVRWWQQGRSLGLSEAVQEAELLSEEGRQPGSRRHTAPLGGGPARTRKDNTSSGTTSSAEAPHPRMRLTEREYEIALLVSSGKSNPEIARALFIAPATAARHVANINRKMGFNSRAQIAEWITQHESAS